MVQDEETQWLNRVYSRSVERLHSNINFGTPPLNQQRGEAIAVFSTMRHIARRRNPKAIRNLNQLEQLCLNAIDGIISDKQFVHGCKRVARESKVSNHITDFLDDLKINQSDIHNQRKQTINNEFWDISNSAWKQTGQFGKAQTSKSKNSNNAANNAFSFLNGTLSNSRSIKRKKVVSPFDIPDVFNNGKNSKSFANVKNSSPAKSVRQSHSGSGRPKADIWFAQNSVFSKRTGDISKRAKARLNKTGILGWN